MSIVAAQHGCKPTDCYDLKCYMVSTGKDGPHTIYPGTATLSNLSVSCDQTTDGGGWIIYQRRLDGSVDFAGNWNDYKIGFGTIGNNTDEMWLGNEKLFQIQQAYGSIELEFRIEATSFDRESCWATFHDFKMSSETGNYSITWNHVHASHRPMILQINMHNGTRFSAKDRYTCEEHCVTMYEGAWWFHFCASFYFNGVYIPRKTSAYTSIFVNGFVDGETLKTSCMMFRPVNGTTNCNNPCQNGGTCKYVADTNGYVCVCSSNSCGNNCEFVRPCQNATCVYDNATKAIAWESKTCVAVLPDTTTAGATDLPDTTTAGANDLPAKTTDSATDLPAKTTYSATDLPAKTTYSATDLSATTTYSATDLPATTTAGATDLSDTTTAGATDLPATTTDSATDLPATTTDGVTEDTGPEKSGFVGLMILLLFILLLTAATFGFFIYRP